MKSRLALSCIVLAPLFALAACGGPAVPQRAAESAATARSSQAADPRVASGIAAYERRDYSAALRILRPLAEQGNADAQVQLGFMYARGDGVKADQAEAMRLYEQAAAQGNAEGMNAIGYKYDYGTGVPRDAAAAMSWYRKAIDHGSPRALNNLAIMYHQGRGIPADRAEALRLWMLAAEQGNQNAMHNLGSAYLEPPESRDVGLAFRWWQAAASGGHTGAMRSIAVELLSGRYVAPDREQGIRWLELAAARGDAAAMVDLGGLYRGGDLVKQDLSL
ncbi:MAG TPA: tetratricopeptide repeat protein, partial [Alphaproteobacteria bacterium]|nr:tetratricopeptide repeat protein [Alphaproteobacteria bacterium]